MKTNTTQRFCLFHQTHCHGAIPAYYSEQNGKELPVTYATRKEAEDEILDDVLEHVAQIRSGERDFDDGIGFEDWVEEVDVLADGSVITESVDVFGARE